MKIENKGMFYHFWTNFAQQIYQIFKINPFALLPPFLEYLVFLAFYKINPRKTLKLWQFIVIADKSGGYKQKEKIIKTLPTFLVKE